jgi:hypothetical protein
MVYLDAYGIPFTYLTGMPRQRPTGREWNRPILHKPARTHDVIAAIDRMLSEVPD